MMRTDLSQKHTLWFILCAVTVEILPQRFMISNRLKMSCPRVHRTNSTAQIADSSANQPNAHQHCECCDITRIETTPCVWECVLILQGVCVGVMGEG